MQADAAWPRLEMKLHSKLANLTNKNQGLGFRDFEEVLGFSKEQLLQVLGFRVFVTW